MTEERRQQRLLQGWKDLAITLFRPEAWQAELAEGRSEVVATETDAPHWVDDPVHADRPVARGSGIVWTTGGV